MPRLSSRTASAAIAPSRPGPSTFLQAPPLQIGLALLGGALLGIALVANLKATVALALAVLALLVAIAALTRPAAVFVGLVALIALVPTYWAPAAGWLLIEPGAALAWLVFALVAWRNYALRGRVMRVNAIDFAVAVFGLLMCISLAFSPQVEYRLFVNDLFLWGGPYLAARVLLAETPQPARLLAGAFALTIAIVAPIAILEAGGMENPFFSIQLNSAEASVWATSHNRLGGTRAQVSFGHPIALSMFAAAAALLALAMAIASKRRAPRYGWLLAALLALAVQALTSSRTGWVMLGIGIVCLVATSVNGAARRRAVSVLLSVCVVLLGVASLLAPSQLEVLPIVGGSQEASLEGSGDYREALLKRALEPGVLHLWGNPTNEVTPAVSNFNLATDNQYIILADHWGLIPTFALIAVALVTLLYAFRVRSPAEPVAPIASTVAVASLAGLFFVAFITQQQLFVWLLVGAAAAVAAQQAEASEAGAAAPAQ